MDENEHYAYFTITGSFNPDEITRRVGIAPTRCWSKGDINPKTHLERKFSRWSLYSRLDRKEELETHVSDVLIQLEQNSEAFQNISQEFEACMELVGYFRVSYPDLYFERDMIEKLAKYSLEVSFDFYYLYSDRREDT
ncbi:DUF4279 domain-containing protein [Roseofilum sp. Guam]|uniref:DUF4279 domain-containing protein n=1 Tax=Roseofilum sp. Guam TaxID=2821502 RepID=UPI001B28B06F|nr:DUF4279 domain-containing protein [Roseofilum sp. Guam]MBP0027179.1 DUF4279 domain-containing protein [Roseofilum sp. Guam]